MCDASLWQDVLGGLQQLGTVSFADLNQGTDIDAMADRIIASLPEKCVLIGFLLVVMSPAVLPRKRRNASVSWCY
jgi:hypothetical protein